MDKVQAGRNIKEVFENPFDEGRFHKFVKELLNDIDETKAFEYHGSYIPEAYREHIKQYKRIGQFSDAENNVLDILIVQLKKETSLERARTMQRNFVAHYLKNRDDKDNALVAYYTDGVDDWRFSFVRMDYREEKKSDGKIKIKTDLTPARRYSFLVGKNEPSHTAQQQLVPLLQDTENNPTLARIEQAFNIEKVTDEFFENYRELFIWTKETLDKVVSKDHKLKADFESKRINTVDFSKKLLGQIVFLQFLQKKGWFGVTRDADFGTGPKHFLRELFDGKHGKYKNFFNDILEPLFYEALRIDRREADNFYSRFNCRIPFLNGGLFDPVGNYDWVHTDITLPNELFSNTKMTKQDVGNGILDVFDRFNFTVNEDEPLEKEVAIDPELLGKAYEKFNAIRPDNFEEYKKVLKSGNKGEENKFNKQYGVYYTPRDIVHFMCRQSLISYLSTELSGKTGTDTVEFLILEGEKYIEYLKTAGEKKEQDVNSKKYKETEHFIELKKFAKEIDRLLANMKVCDPAAGSGAFPVGMMTEIVKARMFFRETNCFEEKKNQTRYNLKKDCIEYSLFGVDIDPGAVEIAKLRLWLSLVVEEENIEEIEALPNLDYKIKQGDSLLSYYHGVSLEPHKRLAKGEYAVGRKQRIEEAITEITKKKKEFFSTSDAGKKKAIQTQIDNLLKSLVVIEIEIEIDTLQKETAQDNLFGMTKKQQQEHEAIEKEIARLSDVKNELIAIEGLPANFPVIWDVDFGEVMNRVRPPSSNRDDNEKEFGGLAEQGFDVVIANPPYGADLSDEYRNQLKLFYKKFDSQMNSASIFIELAQRLVNKNGVVTYIVPKSLTFSEGWNPTRELVINDNRFLTVIDVSEAFENVLLEQVIISFQATPTKDYEFITGEGREDEIKIIGKVFTSICKELNSIPIYASPEYLQIYSKLKSDGIPLSSISTTFRGLPWQNRLTKDGEAILRGKQIQRYGILPAIDYVKVTKEEQRLEKIKRLRQKKIVSQRIVAHVTKPRDRIIIMGSLDDGILNLDTVENTILIDNNFGYEFILGLMNSTLGAWFYYWFVFNRAVRTMDFDKYYVGKLPIPNINKVEQEKVIVLVNKLLKMCKDNPSSSFSPQAQALYDELDSVIYALYGLSKEEIKIIEEGVKGNNA